VSRIWDALKNAEKERTRAKGGTQGGPSSANAGESADPANARAIEQEHPNSDGADRRRSQRWGQPVPVLIYGSDSEKQPFHEETETVEINDHGCSFVIATGVSGGQRLFLVNMWNEAERECRVVQTIRNGGGKRKVAVEFAGGESVDFWMPRTN
jgi:hypothetical protein